MILSRAKPASGEGARKSVSRKEIPTLEQFLAQRDYTGALTLLEFNDVPSSNKDSQIWIAYCAFHLGNYKKAADIYTNLKNDQDAHADIDTYIACCFFYLGMYPESEKMLANAPDSQLKTRLLLHLSCKLSKTNKIKEYEDKLQNNVEDQLCLASVHYLQTHYQEAIDIYKKVLLKNRDYLALNVYVALCYYKLDYYDVAQKVLQVYLQKYPDSATAINLKACNIFHYYKSTSEMAEIKQLIDKASNANHFNNDLIQHNTVVFRNGEGALQILPGLVDVIPEARLNLVIYYLKQNEIQEAHELIKELEPSVAQEYILKGIVNAILGQERNSREYIKSAQQFFQLVGTSASECDTIPGRQCMASFYFLYRQFKDVLIYLNSIRSYFSNVDGFNFNYAQAQAAVGHFKEAEEAFLAIRNDRYRNDFTYINILAYCHIMNKKGQLAWELYLKMEPSSESFGLLQLIANSCYVVGEFWYAAKAFDMLERLDPSPEHWEGKRGACCGTFQCIVMEKLPKELLSEVIKILKNTNNTQAEQIIRVMRKWGKENRVSF
ncbi:PREDICTED: intraflagellar transport protein 56 [Ceratosolen solmsi marchali]|uniref:Intraflagellar transport protein 56 n=1 Tax=Ceratosolen solmsi marchali TaxID=326594 RepID=A0AAJ6YK21_9HYME|nr:PREDICTED: intraflagellar transport protein 56 [Ceratosolen solmsi marchali]